MPAPSHTQGEERGLSQTLGPAISAGVTQLHSTVDGFREMLDWKQMRQTGALSHAAMLEWQEKLITDAKEYRANAALSEGKLNAVNSLLELSELAGNGGVTRATLEERISHFDDSISRLTTAALNGASAANLRRWMGRSAGAKEGGGERGSTKDLFGKSTKDLFGKSTKDHFGKRTKDHFGKSTKDLMSASGGAQVVPKKGRSIKQLGQERVREGAGDGSREGDQPKKRDAAGGTIKGRPNVAITAVRIDLQAVRAATRVQAMARGRIAADHLQRAREAVARLQAAVRAMAVRRQHRQQRGHARRSLPKRSVSLSASSPAGPTGVPTEGAKLVDSRAAGKPNNSKAIGSKPSDAQVRGQPAKKRPSPAKPPPAKHSPAKIRPSASPAKHLKPAQHLEDVKRPRPPAPAGGVKRKK